ncbi:hypothetical protein GCM10027515_19760 [Schumannella luteola]|uniref:Uncharacterized protein n=1 Tax=Schumannella luteola TaxID=472059 RepID=A0A852YM12_9MICO|nr:hypothetical protein [Schumannella luteola]NYH00229.1 hypothetical protein [Schumannella luteola]TPX04024.1 hypothetical protein FJ656_13545 [Schumannella luteola]
MTALHVVLWILAILVIAGATVVAAIGVRRDRPIAGLVPVVPIAIGLLLALLGVRIPSHSPVLEALLALVIAAAGVVAGSPLTMLVLRRTAPAADAGRGSSENAGIRADSDRARPAAAASWSLGEEVPDEALRSSAGSPGAASTAPREVLRGGGVIGYLERFAIIGSVALGHIEVLAAVIAIKGLGRFNDLDSSAARERFIIGTLVSMIWAGSCAALILVTGLIPKLG